MKSIADGITWLLEKDIRSKNAVAALVGLVAASIVYLTSRKSQWFLDLQQPNLIPAGIALLVVFLIAFLITLLVWTAIAHRGEQQRTLQRVEDKETQRAMHVANNLRNLNDSQRGLLARFVRANKRHFEEFEIGGHKLVWQADVDMMVSWFIVNWNSLFESLAGDRFNLL
jgi:hypothetical protein